MKPSPRGSSSDLERARATAQRLSQEVAPGERPSIPDDGAGYIRFSARRLGQGAGPESPAVPDHRSAPPPPPAPELPSPLPSFRALEPESQVEPESLVEAKAQASEERGFEVEFPGRGEPEAGAEAEDIIEQLVADIEDEEEPPSWPQILEACVSVSHSRAGIIVDAEGHILQASEQLPKNKLDAIAARLLQVMQEIPAENALPETSRSVAVQLGAFWLTGLRVALGGEQVTIGLLAPSQLSPEVLPAVDAEIRRGARS